jgi:molybdenum cofactor cytidylyltransferase
MRAQSVEVTASPGRLLSSTIFRDGKKLLPKGRLISEDDMRVLQSEGMHTICVTELEEGEMGEDDAVAAVSMEMGCGSYEIRMAAGGRANFVATEDCCVLVDDDLLKQINCTASVVTATLPNFSYAKAGRRIATVKSAPFAVSGDQVHAITAILRERGPILQARPFRTPSVAVLYTDPTGGDRARVLFESNLRQLLERYGTSAAIALSCTEEENSVTRCLHQLLRSNPCLILVASNTAPAGPEDEIGQAMLRAGCHVERFLAPVEPGNLLLLSYKDDLPILSAPGCFRSTKPNVVDLVLPPLLARYRVSGSEVAGLGHGGLLS